MKELRGCIALRLPSLNPNIRSYFSHFGRTILVVLGLLIIIGLAAGTYFYGVRKNDEKNQEQTTSTNQPEAQPAPTNNPNQSSPQPPDSQSSTPVSGGSTPSQHANTGPTTLSNTGPAEESAIIMSGLTLLTLVYRRSRRQLTQALRTI